MNKLTDRLQLIADNITNGETMADIGTDHGFLPLYLYKKGICPKVIMTDISRPSLAKAVDAFAECCGNGYDFRLGDGIKVIEINEVDTVVIAGMGGLLIRDILSDDLDKTRGFNKLILQPRNNSGHLRYWLNMNGFRITCNLLVREGRFICEVIIAEPSDVMNSNITVKPFKEYDPSNPEWEFPDELIGKYPVLGKESALNKLAIEERIRDGVLKSCNICESDMASIEKRIDYFSKLVDKQLV